jgi:hypothetical protein
MRQAVVCKRVFVDTCAFVQDEYTVNRLECRFGGRPTLPVE